MKKAILKIPPPHPKQAEIENCPKKRILINAGRRGGKTFMVVRKAVKAASEGKRVLYIAPVVAQTDAFWDYACEWLDPAVAAGLVKKQMQKRTLLFQASGGRIEARTGHKPDHLRGGWGDYVILDEYAYQDPNVWDKVCQPMMLDTDGTAIFISTPDKRNHFYYTYLKALEDPAWAVFTFPSHENPHLSEEALAQLTEDMTDVDYRQEILAEFVPGVGAVFILDPDDFCNDNGGNHGGHRIVAGLDWGRKQDFTVLSIGCATCHQELALVRTNQIEYHMQRELVKQAIRDYNKVELLAEENAMGLPNIEQLILDGIDVIPFNTTNSSKATLVQALRLAFTQHSWKWLDDPIAMRELESYEMTISPSGLARYGAPEGLHDDTVMARMLMLYQANTGQLQFY